MASVPVFIGCVVGGGELALSLYSGYTQEFFPFFPLGAQGQG